MPVTSALLGAGPGSRRLPRIEFETVAPPIGDPLPRMDIAGFVGFVAAGPLHTPIAIEDAATFRATFGEDVLVAVDADTSAPLRSLLGPAVEAFFRGGGRRCWVVGVSAPTTADAVAFLDPALAGLGTRALRYTAEQIAHLSDSPRALEGIHALFDVAEVSMIAVPDAALPTWRPGLPPQPPLPVGPPVLHALEPVGRCAADLSWDPVPGAAAFTVQWATSPDFADAVVAHEGPAPANRIEVDLPCECRQRFWLRVRATDDLGEVGPWSATVSIVVPASPFEGCDAPPDPPVLALEADGTRLSWAPIGAAPVEVQRAGEATFELPVARTVAAGVGQVEITPPTTGIVFHRVRWIAADGSPTAWSDTVVAVAVPQEITLVDALRPEEEAPVLLAVQRALLRLCATRGDTVAVLSTAAHHDDDGAAAHVAALCDLDLPGVVGAPGSADVLPLDHSEDRALSYATISHPWVAMSALDGVRMLPPDGPVCGALARMTLADGAWRSPGGQPLTGVLGTAPLRDRTAPAVLTQAGLDVVTRNPHSEALLTATTLATDDTLRPIGVRRLLILLRRLALRHGDTYVFEPNGPRFHAMVRRLFEQILGDLHQRGALVGLKPADAYRVVVDDSVNIRASLDAGRFVVELHVAPSHPLDFIRVRLVQSDPGVLDIAEVTT